jgi:hypothetical protein
MSFSGNNSLSIVVENCGSPSETVTIFHTAEEAQALWATLVVNPSASHYLFLESIPTKELKPTKVSGTYVDAFGVTRVFQSGVNGGEID